MARRTEPYPSVKGHFCMINSDHDTVGGIVLASNTASLVNQDLQFQQLFDKKRSESISIGCCHNVLILFSHKKCDGEKCPCYRTLQNYFYDENLAANPVAFFDVCSSRISAPYFVTLGCHNNILCFQCQADKSVRQEVISPGMYSLGFSRLNDPSPDDLEDLNTHFVPWIQSDVDGSAVIELLANGLGSKKAVALVLNNSGTTFAKVGYRTRAWKPRGYVSDYNFFTQRYRPLVAADRPELNVAAVNVILGNLWKNLSKAEKRMFEDMAETDKLRYWQEVETYNSQAGLKEKIIPKICTPPDVKSDPNRRKTPRIESSYSHFAHQEKQFVFGLERPDLKKKMGMIVGHRWRNMDNEERELYDMLEQSCAKRARACSFAASEGEDGDENSQHQGNV